MSTTDHIHPAPAPKRRLATLAQFAKYRGVSQRSVRAWALKGYLNLYRVQGVRGVVIDIDEATHNLARLTEQGLIRPDHGSFHGQRITTLAEVVDEEVTR